MEIKFSLLTIIFLLPIYLSNLHKKDKSINEMFLRLIQEDKMENNIKTIINGESSLKERFELEKVF
jgi:hypothetical protein